MRCSWCGSPSFGAGLMAPKGECGQPGRIPVALAHPASPVGSAPGQAHSALALAQNPQHSHIPALRHSAPWVRSSSTLCPSPQGCPGHGVPAVLSVSEVMLMLLQGGLGVDPIIRLLPEVWRLPKQRGEKKKKRIKMKKKKKRSHTRKHITGLSLSFPSPPAGCVGAAGAAPVLCLPPPQPWVLLCAKLPALALLGRGTGESRACCSPSPFDKAKRLLPSLCKFCTVPESESLVSWGNKKRKKKKNKTQQ